jgi:hypothetical protein
LMSCLPFALNRSLQFLPRTYANLVVPKRTLSDQIGLTF